MMLTRIPKDAKKERSLMLKMNRIIADKDIIVNKQPKLKSESSFDIEMMFSQNYNVLDK
jgi:hypothetical protein